MRANKILMVFLTVVLFAPSLALAHDFWLEPADGFRPAVGDVISLRMFVGEAFKPEQELPGVADRVKRLEVIGSGGKFEVAPAGPRDPLPLIALSDPGTYVIVMERDPSFITLAAEKFNSYLEEEGHHALVSARLETGTYAKDGRERYTRHLKMILTVGRPSDAWSKILGTRLEIVPLSDPAKLKAGAALAVRVLFEGKPLPDARVGLVTRSGKTVSRETYSRTNAAGETRMTVASGGDLLIRTTFMRACVKCENADYESFWSSMTMAVPE